MRRGELCLGWLKDYRKGLNANPAQSDSIVRGGKSRRVRVREREKDIKPSNHGNRKPLGAGDRCLGI